MTTRYDLLFVLVFLMVVTAVSSQAYPTLYPALYPTSYSSFNSTFRPTLYPTLYGDTGLVLIPTAEVLPFVDFNLAVDYTQLTRADGTTSPGIPIRLDYGIADNVELFAVYAPATSGGLNIFGGGVKVLLAAENCQKHIPALAVGGRFIETQDITDIQQINAYAVISSTLLQLGDPNNGPGYQILGHLGANYSRFSTAGTNNSFAGLFGGLSYEAFNGVTVSVDYVPELKNNGITFQQSTLSGAIRLPIADEWFIQLGGTRPFATGSTTLIAGLDYHYSGNQNSTPYSTANGMY